MNPTEYLASLASRRIIAPSVVPSVQASATVTVSTTDTDDRSRTMRAIEDSEPIECHEWSGERLTLDDPALF